LGTGIGGGGVAETAAVRSAGGGVDGKEEKRFLPAGREEDNATMTIGGWDLIESVILQCGRNSLVSSVALRFFYPPSTSLYTSLLSQNIFVGNKIQICFCFVAMECNTKEEV